MYEKGDRVELVRTSDAHTKLVPGSKGTVRSLREVQGFRVLGVAWDDGSSLAMLIDEGDMVKKLPPMAPPRTHPARDHRPTSNGLPRGDER
jgi:Domain of unknown function (DUF4314)